jgi:endonuclease/exonuclease/phosphatase family metal-dependent hydrolase
MEDQTCRIRVATYNVHRCVGVDGRRDPGRIARLIRELKADVIGLQEVDSRSFGTHESAQMSIIAAATGLHALAGPTILTTNGHYGNVLLTRWPVRKKTLIDLTFRRKEPRGAIDALLDVDGEPLRVVATHLGLSISERLYQTRRLKDILCNKREDVLVFLGDINEWIPRSHSLRLVHRCLGRAPACRTFPSYKPFLALDRIWVRPREALASLGTVKTPLTRTASDHLPVVAEIMWPAVLLNEEHR